MRARFALFLFHHFACTNTKLNFKYSNYIHRNSVSPCAAVPSTSIRCVRDSSPPATKYSNPQNTWIVKGSGGTHSFYSIHLLYLHVSHGQQRVHDGFLSQCTRSTHSILNFQPSPKRKELLSDKRICIKCSLLIQNRMCVCVRACCVRNVKTHEQTECVCASCGKSDDEFSIDGRVQHSMHWLPPNGKNECDKRETREHRHTNYWMDCMHKLIAFLLNERNSLLFIFFCYFFLLWASDARIGHRNRFGRRQTKNVVDLNCRPSTRNAVVRIENSIYTELGSDDERSIQCSIPANGIVESARERNMAREWQRDRTKPIKSPLHHYHCCFLRRSSNFSQQKLV